MQVTSGLDNRDSGAPGLTTPPPSGCVAEEGNLPLLTRTTLSFSSVLFCLFVYAAPAATAATLLVPGDFATIQAAIDAAVDGDTIDVAAGTYLEVIDFLGKDIHVRAISGPDMTTIDAESADAVVRFANGEPSTAILEGFTIANGQTGFLAPGNGGGIAIEGASPTVRGNHIIDNVTPWFGAGIYVNGGAPTIEDNTIESNGFFCLIADAPCGLGAGIYVEEATVLLVGNRFYSNVAPSQGGAVFTGTNANVTLVNNVIDGNSGGLGGGVVAGPDSVVDMFNNLIVDNTAFGYSTLLGPIDGFAGGVWAREDSTVTMNSNTIAGNAASGFIGTETTGGGLLVETADFSAVNMIVWNNTAAVDPQIAAGSVLDISYSDVDGGYSGVGNLDVDPLFVSGPEGEFYLSQVAAGQVTTSECVDAGDPAEALILGTTRTDHEPDSNEGDLGFHYAGTTSGFRRGDLNEDGGRDISDAVFGLGALFVIGSPQPNCTDAADVNDDGGFDVGDPVFLLAVLFQPGSAPLPEPVACGQDPTPDSLPCPPTACP